MIKQTGSTSPNTHSLACHGIPPGKLCSRQEEPSGSKTVLAAQTVKNKQKITEKRMRRRTYFK